MTLATGTRFGAYEITGPLGVGGMGEVYRATDTHLKRDVAVKVLPPSFADDADRLARFQREAEVLASLNHPNIAQVYGLEKSAGTSALILELVEGPTLAERIAQGPVPADEALHIARQIADALEAAHGRGIVHRDLKPANIKLKPDGKLIYQTGAYPRDIRITSIGQAEPLEGTPLLAAAADEAAAALSPNGRWLAYHSNESGQSEIYVRPYPDVDSGRRQVSTNGGVHPLWSRDGKELFYLDLGGGTQGRGDLYAVPVETEGSFQAGVPSKLIANVFAGGNYKHPYDVSPDGRRFLMIREVEATEPARIVIVQNWFDELERLAPAK